MGWILARLADAPEVQTKLRAEIDAALAVATGEGRSTLSLDEIYGLSYLDGVIVGVATLGYRETGLTETPATSERDSSTGQGDQSDHTCRRSRRRDPT